MRNISKSRAFAQKFYQLINFQSNWNGIGRGRVAASSSPPNKMTGYLNVAEIVSEQFVDLKSVEDAHRYLYSLIGHYGVSHATYFAQDLPAIDGRRNVLVTTYAKDWADHYFEKRYDQIDPVLVYGASGILPFDWNLIPMDSRPVHRFFGEAREFGVGENGISIPIRGAHGDQALFSVTTDLSNNEWQMFKHDMLGHLMLIAYSFHSAVLRMETDVWKWENIHLSPREVEALKWAAEGKSAWEISMILGLSQRTIEFYLGNATAKLGAINRTQAAATAVRLGFIR